MVLSGLENLVSLYIDLRDLKSLLIGLWNLIVDFLLNFLASTLFVSVEDTERSEQLEQLESEEYLMTVLVMDQEENVCIANYQKKYL